ncbi:MAG: ADP-ribosylglycohydrolase family protein [Desulfobacteraceae bacterium]|jgi:ADP-ribosylglycohydrolase
MKGESSNPEKNFSNVPLESRMRGCIYGLFIGDALAMPVHWYYDRLALRRDYGQVRDYLEPRNPHPDSILWRSSYKSINKKGDILHEQAQYWGQHGVHYHQFLKAGENTLNLKLCALLIESLNKNGGYDADDYLKRYINYMTTPGNHRDTYVEEYHRHFFTQYAKGAPPRKCGVQEKHIGGLVGVVPIVVFYRDDPEKAKKAALEHLSLTHLGPKMEGATLLLADLLLQIFNGSPLKEALMAEMEKQRSPFAGYPFLKWLDEEDELVVGRRFSTACYVEESVPSVIYLALKYHDDPEGGLIANTNLGGDNAYRGAVLGALLGAANGIEAFPERWIKGLRHTPPEFSKPAHEGKDK